MSDVGASVDGAFCSYRGSAARDQEPRTTSERPGLRPLEGSRRHLALGDLVHKRRPIKGSGTSRSNQGLLQRSKDERAGRAKTPAKKVRPVPS